MARTKTAKREPRQPTMPTLVLKMVESAKTPEEKAAARTMLESVVADIKKRLADTNGDVAKCAVKMKLNERTLYRAIESLGLWDFVKSTRTRTATSA